MTSPVSSLNSMMRSSFSVTAAKAYRLLKGSRGAPRTEPDSGPIPHSGSPRYFGTSERFWMNLQTRYDLEVEKDRLGTTLDDIRPLSAAS